MKVKGPVVGMQNSEEKTLEIFKRRPGNNQLDIISIRNLEAFF